MYQNKKMVWYAMLFISGIGIIIWAILTENNSIWGGLGGSFAGVGGMRLFQGIRCRMDREFARENEVNRQDERVRFLNTKAQAWAFSLTILVLSLAVILLRLYGQNANSLVCAYIVCGMLVAYYVFYLILNKKY